MFEKDHNVIWDLERCHDLLKSKDISPKVVATDFDNALINVVDIVFPEATTLFCVFYIGKIVRAKCKTSGKDTKSSEVVKTIMVACEAIVNSNTKFPEFLEYVETAILGPMEEKIVNFWVNQVMHMRNTTTNRTEYVHYRLKRYLTSSMSDVITN